MNTSLQQVDLTDGDNYTSGQPRVAKITLNCDPSASSDTMKVTEDVWIIPYVQNVPISCVA